MTNPPSIPWLTLCSICGQGGGGTVWIARDPGGISRAVKVIPYGNSIAAGRQAVTDYRQNIPHHPSLIDIFFSGDTDDCFYYVMELADNASTVPGKYIPDTLAYRMQKKRLQPAEILCLMQKITSGVAALHSQGFAHRDLKPENILFIHGEPKIGDPDLLSRLDHCSYTGTPEYLPGHPCPAEQQDLHALGKLLYCMFTGESPDAFPSLPEDLQGDLAITLNRIAISCCDTAHPYCNIRELQKNLQFAADRMTPAIRLSLKFIMRLFLHFSHENHTLYRQYRE